MGQFLFAHQWVEPYPAFLFPGFSNVPSTDGKIQTTDVQVEVITSDGSTQGVSYQKLFNTVPAVHDYVLMLRLFSDGGIVPDTSSGNASPSYPLPDWHESRTREDLRGQLRRYVRRRMDDLGISKAQSLRVSWVRRTVERDGSEHQRIKSTHVLSLEP
jgi:hypothetical protein